MAAKILANLIVMGSGILARAVVQAYRQALAIQIEVFWQSWKGYQTEWRLIYSCCSHFPQLVQSYPFVLLGNLVHCDIGLK